MLVEDRQRPRKADADGIRPARTMESADTDIGPQPMALRHDRGASTTVGCWATVAAALYHAGENPPTDFHSVLNPRRQSAGELLTLSCQRIAREFRALGNPPQA